MLLAASISVSIVVTVRHQVLGIVVPISTLNGGMMPSPYVDRVNLLFFGSELTKWQQSKDLRQRDLWRAPSLPSPPKRRS